MTTLRHQPVNPRLLAARILDKARDYPWTLSDGERALVVEIEALQSALNHQAAKALGWRDRYFETRHALEQTRGQLDMTWIELAGLRAGLTPQPTQAEASQGGAGDA